MRAILYVETRPNSSAEVDDYHAWYDSHIRKLLTIEGFIAARRYEPMESEGPFVTIYEIDAEDIDAARRRLRAAAESGTLPDSPLVQSDPPSTVRYLREIAAYREP